MGERGFDARQTQGTEDRQMQRVLLAGRETEEAGLSSLDSVSEDRVTHEEGEEEVDKMVSTWPVVSSGGSRRGRSTACGEPISGEPAFFKRKAARLCRSLSRVALDFFLGLGRFSFSTAAGNGNPLFSEL